MSYQKYLYAFTVFTPTYNRAYTLGNVYESLKNQTFKDFEWLIVDGGKDNTHELVAQWQKESWFPIRHMYQEGRGKYAAVNMGVREAHGRFFLPLDSDDTCVPNALERLKFHWDQIPDENKNQYSAVTALCIDTQGNVVGDLYPEPYLDSNTIESLERYGIKGEKWGFQRIDVLKEFPCPLIENEAFSVEGVVWNRISQIYKTRYVNEKLRIYKPRPDGLMAQSLKLLMDNPKSARLYYLEAFKCYKTITYKTRFLLHYIRVSFHGHVPVSQIVKDTGHVFMALFLLPLGYSLYVKDNITVGKKYWI